MTGQSERDVRPTKASTSKKRPLSSWVAARPLFVWISSIIAVAVGAVASAWAVSLFGPPGPRHHTISSQFICKSKEGMTAGRSTLPPHGASPFVANTFLLNNGLGYTIFQQDINLSVPELRALPGSIRHSVESYNGYSTVFDLTLTSRRRVRVMQMQAYVVSRSPSLTGTQFWVPYGGQAASTQLTSTWILLALWPMQAQAMARPARVSTSDLTL